jgi:hypothetical protein
MLNNNDNDMSRIEACKVELEALKTMQDIWSKMYEIGTLDREKFDLNMCELLKDALNVRNDMDWIRRKDN